MQENTSLIDKEELRTFKEKTDQLMSNLESNDFESALHCINELNTINEQNMFTIIGKLTRGLHEAINDLNISSRQEILNHRTRASLDYVMQATGEAAGKTLDMTEKSMSYVQRINAGLQRQKELMQEYLEDSGDAGINALLRQLEQQVRINRHCTEGLSASIKEIVIAQNYQDLTSQSISKATRIIREVEHSLVSLTQYASLLRKLSPFSDRKRQYLEQSEREEIRSNIDRLGIPREPEHLDQDEVDDLLSSLGF